MADLLRIDPLTVFNFYLTLTDTSDLGATIISAVVNYAVAGFSECSGLDASIEVFEYKEGGVNDHVHKFPTRASFSNITLKQGIVYLYDDLWKWHHSFVIGQGKRKDGTIVLLDESGKPAKVWAFKAAVPVKWSGPALNASQSNVAIESLELSHEGLDLQVGV